MRLSTLFVAALVLAPATALAQDAVRQTPPPDRATTTTVAPVQQTVAVQRGVASPTTRNNVRLDLTITDSYADVPSRKTVSMLILDGSNGMIRTSNRLPPPTTFQVELNVDATAHILPIPNTGIRVQVTFEYTPAQSGDENRRSPAELHESLTVVLQDGKPLLVSQSADPASDRKVTVELTATILK